MRKEANFSAVVLRNHRKVQYESPVELSPKTDSTYFIRCYFKLGYMIPIFISTLKPLSVLSLYISSAHSLLTMLGDIRTHLLD